MAGDLISVDQARSRVLDAVRRLDAEAVGLGDALGRVLAEDVLADVTLPPFDSSAMDGFALVAGAGGELQVVGESRAGAPFAGAVAKGQAVRISTGAVLPRGADAVVPVERVEMTGADGAGHGGADRAGASVRVPGTQAGANIRRAGEDVRAGDVVIRAGSELRAAELGMLAALGRGDAICTRRPRVAIAATGDELREPGEALAPGQIYDSNAPAVAALAQDAGAEVVRRVRIADSLETTVAQLDRALAEANAICITGGVSVGPHDHVKPALAQLGFEERIWGVSLKPGKPFYFGVRGNQYAFGLPGNPVSAMVTFTLFARPLLRALQGADPAAVRSSAILDAPVRSTPDRDQAVRCRLEMRDDGWHARPTGPQGSHVISSMIGANALAIVPAGERDLAAGQRVLIEVL